MRAGQETEGRSGRRAPYRPGAVRALAVLVIATASVAPLLPAPIPLQSLIHSTDTSGLFAGMLVRDEEAVLDDLMGGVALLSLGALPVSADIDALAEGPGGEVLFSLDTHATLSGSLVASADVVQWDGVAFTVAFHAAGAGVPPGADVDALAIDPATGDLLLSFDAAVDLDGVVAADEDLVRWNGAAWSLAFDGSAAGLEAKLDVDGAHIDSDGVLLLSFDTPGAVDGVSFHDEDVLAFDDGAGTWALAIDNSALHVGWVAADLDALVARGVIPTDTATPTPTATVASTPTSVPGTTPEGQIYEIPTLGRRGLLVLAVLFAVVAALLRRR